MSNPSRHVYVVDDDSSLRRSLQFALTASGYEPRPFVSGSDFLEELPQLSAGCVLLDIRMPEMSGFQVLSAMQTSGRRFPVIVMTGHGDIPTAVEAMKLGADDFLEKPFAEDALLTSLRMLSERLNEWADGNRIVAESREKVALLSPRELEVLRGLIAGYPNKVTARKLSLSVRTVEAYRADLMRKMQMSSVAELVRLGLLFKLSPLD